MQFRELGNTGVKISVLGFGGWGIGGGNDWNVSSDEDSIKSIKQAMELGVNFFDSALGYGGGHSEEVIGKAVKGQRDKCFITSKIPPKNYTWPQKSGTPIEEAYSVDWIVECTEKSLKNYDVECIDLQQFHVWLNEWTDSDVWQEAVRKLKKDGKIRFIGASLNFPYSDLDNGIPTMKAHLFDAVQVVHNIYQQSPARDIFPVALESNTGVVARCPLDEGALSGKITPDTKFPAGSFLERYFKDDRCQIAYDKANELNWLIEEGFAGSLAEAAIRYCLSFPAVTSLVVGMRTAKHTEANAAAAELGPLPQEVIERLKPHEFHHDWWI